MIYHLAQMLQPTYSWLNLFRYVSFRAMGALLTALFISFIFGGWVIKVFKRLFASQVRDNTPSTHQAKNGMPTMGGLFIIGVVIASAGLWCNLRVAEVWILVGTMIGFGLIGFIDDYYKIIRKRGISAGVKFGSQCLFATIGVYAWLRFVAPATTLVFPFFKHLQPNIGWLFIPWAVFVLVGTSNAVNLTDGLDGLAIGSLLSNFSLFVIVAYMSSNFLFADYLAIPYTTTAELVVLGAALFGASLGFLWYNTYPAQIFMGDVGSLGLGVALGFMALMTKQELLLPIAGGLFVIETASVIIQVLWYKMFKKRILLMAPIHHHFELLGWQESKITTRFGIISFVLSLIALMTLKMR
jgi:phospho-N-acetylmuramoyl-pentapeptide-transferase